MDSGRYVKNRMLDFGRPAIAGSVSDTELPLIDSRHLEAIDLIELRVDHFADLSHDYITDIFSKAGTLHKPLIGTIRSADEGGQRDIDDNSRLALFELISDYAGLIDIEARSPIFDEVKDIAGAKSKRVIASYHNFSFTPGYDELSLFISDYRSRGADIIKLATKAVDADDLRTMTLVTMNYWQDGIVTICMGSDGIFSRIFFPAIGSLFTFASIGSSKAPGQLSVIELRSHMNALPGQSIS